MKTIERDQKTDHLLTPENCAILMIDFHSVTVLDTHSMDQPLLIRNARILAEMGKAYNIPTILATINNQEHKNDIIPQIADVFPGKKIYDRTVINCWQDEEIQKAIIDTGRKKILIVGLWTEACMTFPTLDMLKEGYEIYPVVDATGGARHISNDTALRRVEQAGAKLVTLPGVLCEIQRDWQDTKTVPDFERLMKEYGAYSQV